jgi:hypothetical protein
MSNLRNSFAAVIGLACGYLVLDSPAALAQIVGPADAFQIHYAANLDVGDSQIDLTNTGTSGGTLCANLYTFDAAEELVSCCTCTVTPNALESVSVRTSLVSFTLTPSIPTSVVVNVLASTGQCNAAALTAGNLASGLRAWSTTLHQNTSTVPPKYMSTETEFALSPLTSGQLNHLVTFCAFLQSAGSGFGVCKGCVPKGL